MFFVFYCELHFPPEFTIGDKVVSAPKNNLFEFWSREYIDALAGYIAVQVIANSRSLDFLTVAALDSFLFCVTSFSQLICNILLSYVTALGGGQRFICFTKRGKLPVFKQYCGSI